MNLLSEAKAIFQPHVHVETLKLSRLVIEYSFRHHLESCRRVLEGLTVSFCWDRFHRKLLFLTVIKYP